MTLPDEEMRSIVYAGKFLTDLLYPKRTPKVPRAIRERAVRVLQHFPAEYRIKDLYGRGPA